MDAEQFIERALLQGEQTGLASLEPVSAVVFAISEAEVYCDMQGVSALIERYGLQQLPAFAASFTAIGATRIAEEIQRVVQSKAINEQSLSVANELICDRAGYDYDTIKAYVMAAMLQDKK